MFRLLKCWLLLFYWISLALGYTDQGFSRNESDNGFGSCMEAIRFSRVVGWNTIIGYTRDSNQNHNLSFCGNQSEDKDCCPIRTILVSSMNEHFNQSFSENLYSVSTVFSLSYKLFNFSFLNLLNHTKFELHYYLVSSNNQQLDEYGFFSDLFWDMEEYFTGVSSINLADSVLAFFDNLIKQLLSFHYNDFNLEENTFICISNLAKEMKPFGDVPVMLGNQMKKSFQLVKIFAQSLRQGQEILALLEKVVTPMWSCMVPIENMPHCFHCSEFDDIFHCSNASCTNLALKCLRGLKTFEHEWLQYVDGLLSFIGCFDLSCNVENVVRMIEQNVMEAIEIFQRAAKQFFKEVETKCGIVPQNYRDKRSPPGFTSSPPPFHPSHMLIEKLKDIKVDIESRRDFINSLIPAACSNYLIPAFPSPLEDLNCSAVNNIFGQNMNISSSIGHTIVAKDLQFINLSQRVRNITEKMRNVLSSYKAFTNEKMDATSSGDGMYSSGSGINEDGDDDDDDDDDEEGDDDGRDVNEEKDNDTFLEEQDEDQEKPVKNQEDDIAFENPSSSCSLKGCHVIHILFITALFFA